LDPADARTSLYLQVFADSQVVSTMVNCGAVEFPCLSVVFRDFWISTALSRVMRCIANKSACCLRVASFVASLLARLPLLGCGDFIGVWFCWGLAAGNPKRRHYIGPDSGGG
jgi:hypothetical protein